MKYGSLCSGYGIEQQYLISNTFYDGAHVWGHSIMPSELKLESLPRKYAVSTSCPDQMVGSIY